jgi:L-alanine-DL-glutamate epimerase-like enolase superfamily enzyme
VRTSDDPFRVVGDASGIPIAAGEKLCFATQFEAMLGAGAVQYAQPSVTTTSGSTEFLRVMALAAARNVRLAPHSPYFGRGALEVPTRPGLGADLDPGVIARYRVG